MSRFLKALEQVERERATREAERDDARPPAKTASWPVAEPSVAPAPPRSDPRPPEAPSRPARRTAAPLRAAPGDLDDRLVSLKAPASFEAEQYRTLRYIVEQLRQRADLQVVAISSPATADGKSTTAINLAGALAQAKTARVLLIDADLRNPSVAEQLRLTETRGVAAFVLDDRVSLDDVVVERPALNLSIVPGGRPGATPYESLGSPRFGELIAQARRRYDFVIVDTPPLTPIADARQVANWVDGMIVVVGAHRTARRLLERALTMLEPSKIVGLVFNGDDACTPRYYGRYLSFRRSNGGRPDSKGR